MPISIAAHIDRINREQAVEWAHDSRHRECLAVAAQTAPAFIADEDDFCRQDIETDWHERLLDESGYLKAAMQHFIDQGEHFTRIHFIKEQI